MSDLKNVTDIARKPHPRLKAYLDALLWYAAPFATSQVHAGFPYPPLVGQTKAWPNVGIFFDYLIRKEMHYLLGRPAVDFRASYVAGRHRRYEEIMLQSSEIMAGAGEAGGYGAAGDIGNDFVVVDDDADGDFRERSQEAPPIPFADFNFYLVRDLVASYELYRDPTNATIDVLEHVFNTSSLHMVFFGHAAHARKYDPGLVNVANCKAVLKHVATWNRTNVRLNPTAGCEYFRGDADLLLDDVLVDVKTSKYALQFGDDDFMASCYQLILYALGLFVRDGRRINKFVMYNPLLGIEYALTMPNLKFEKLLTLVKQLESL